MKKNISKISLGAMIATFILGFILIFSSNSIGKGMGDSAMKRNGGIIDSVTYERILDNNTSNFRIAGFALSLFGGAGIIVSGYALYKELL